jgi:hypothetical protein
MESIDSFPHVGRRLQRLILPESIFQNHGSKRGRKLVRFAIDINPCFILYFVVFLRYFLSHSACETGVPIVEVPEHALRIDDVFNGIQGDINVNLAL